ncbi:MAG: 4-hydroxy-tetrahydrodipicolinate reductase, partial [Chloroflexi bacterium]|nr:4-hydroxy-tetrahydrodipicolinate reductase [Chloroflexota bacterium]
TGLSEDEIEEIGRRVAEIGANVLIAPNFAIGAVLMMRLSEIAVKFMPALEIIELHHDMKADAPSGTAMLTAKKLAEITPGREEPTKKEILPGSRGGDWEGIRVHSVRLPFMAGGGMAAKAFGRLQGLTVGLENILEI